MSAFDVGVADGVKTAGKFKWELARKMERAAKAARDAVAETAPSVSPRSVAPEDAIDAAARMRARIAAMSNKPVAAKPVAAKPAMSEDAWDAAAGANAAKDANKAMISRERKARAAARRRALEIVRVKKPRPATT